MRIPSIILEYAIIDSKANPGWYLSFKGREKSKLLNFPTKSCTLDGIPQAKMKAIWLGAFPKKTKAQRLVIFAPFKRRIEYSV